MSSQPTPPYTKVKTIRERGDDTVEIDSWSTFTALSSVKQEIQQSIKTSGTNLAADVIKCLQHVTFHETTELTIHITTDKKTGEPTLITKTWLVNKEYYGR